MSFPRVGVMKRKSQRKVSTIRRKSAFFTKSGMTLVEVMMSIILVGTASAVVYTGSIYSYKTMMRSRARLSAQGIAFDKLWSYYNLQSPEELRAEADRGWQQSSTPTNSVFGTNGLMRWAVLAPSGTNYWNIWVYVYGPSNTVLFPAGRDPILAQYVVRRSNRYR